MTNQAEIRRARPNLILVAPLTFWIVVGFILSNIFLSHAIYTQPDHSNLALYFGPFTAHFWAGLFMAISILLTYGLASNNWKLVRIMLGVALFLKTFYAYSLFELGTRVGLSKVEGVTTLWMLLVWVQFWTIVFFLPPHINSKVE